MSVQVPELAGKTCESVVKIRHHFRGERDSSRGPVQFNWTDGSVTTVDADTDLTATVSDEPWVDPYAHVVGDERVALERDIGLWEVRPVEVDDPLHAVAGRRIDAVEHIADPDGLLIGFRFRFGEITVTTQIVDVDDWEIDTSVEHDVTR